MSSSSEGDSSIAGEDRPGAIAPQEARALWALCDPGDGPLARLAAHGDLHGVADALADERFSDRRGRRDDREEAVAAGAGELGARPDREEHESALAGRVVIFDRDVDDRADADRRAAAERRHAAVGEGR